MKFKAGDRVILPAGEGAPEQRATVLEDEGSVLMVEIDRADRMPGDRDGLVEVAPEDVKEAPSGE